MLRFKIPSSTAKRIQPSAGVAWRHIGKPPPPPIRNDESHNIYRRRLRDGNYEIRLLELRPAWDRSGSLFQCRIQYHSLTEAPPYSALSYCWGSAAAADKRELEVDGRTIAVPQNLLAALEQLWRMRQRLIWADYLCINQADDEEKSAQVRMMDTIYAKAQPVFAWLGPQSVTDDSDLAMAALGASKQPEQRLPEDIELACDAVVRLFSRPYFRRTWIIQEICRAQSPVVVCGRRWVHWATMLKRVDKLAAAASAAGSVAGQYAQTLIGPLRSIRYRDLFRFRADTETGLISLLITSRRSLARDPRDKLYALLSLSRDGRALIPTPNYAQTPEAVFLDTARSMIAGHDRTDALLLAHRTRGERDLPSWVPDWANLRVKPPPWIVEALAGNCALLRPPNQVRGRLLQVQGCRHDEIAAFLDTAEFAKAPAYAVPRLEACNWEGVVTNLWLGLTIGVGEPPRLQLAMQALYELCCKRATDDNTAPKLAKWIWHNRSRTIGYCTLQQHIEDYLNQAIADDPNVAENDDLELARSALEDGFDRFERSNMVFAITENEDVRAVYRAAEKGDQIYTLQNCPLPVILRDTGHGRHRFVGEVLMPQDSPFTADKRQLQIVLLE